MMPTTPKRTNRLFPKAPPGNGVGISTSQALRTIANCIQYPNEWHAVVDHQGSYSADLAQLAAIKCMVAEMDLKFFEFQKTNAKCRVRCNIYE